MYGKRVRRIGDDYVDGVTPETVKQDILVLLDHIHGFYKEALDRLPVGRVPSLAPRLLKAGVCVGFLDPVSNIIVNTISYCGPVPLPSTESKKNARKLTLSKIITDSQDPCIFDIPLSEQSADGMTVARRSLEGLVSFLIFHFRYLAETEALRYLRLAEADLLAAVHLINRDRNSSCSVSGIGLLSHNKPAFDISSRTAKIALECAAASLKHPEQAILVSASLSAVSRLNEVSEVLQVHHRLSPAIIRRLHRLLRQEPEVMDATDLRRPLHLACSRLLHDGKEKKRKRGEPSFEDTRSMESAAQRKAEMDVTFRYTQSLKLLLLDKIHLLYLEALSRLPRDSLRKHHHCNLLKAGYCYGLMDPVSNIIFNTIWYDTLFSTQHEFKIDFEVEMICTNALMRIECCSLYGLVYLLRFLFPRLMEHDAVWFLLLSNANVWSAIDMAGQHGHTMCDVYPNAFREAAVKSWHPDPEALVKFIKSALNMGSTASVLTQAVKNCSIEGLIIPASSKSLPTDSAEQVQQQDKLAPSSEFLSENQRMFISEIQKKFNADQSFYVRKVKAALKNYSQKEGVYYELHVICGVNPHAIKGGSADLLKKKGKFEYSHINFWATPKESNSAATEPVLFFAECSNDEEEDEETLSLCLPVLSSWISDVRCFQCEFTGKKIVHPYDESYHGRCEDFVGMARGDHSICNEEIISGCDFHADLMCTLKEDWIFFDPNMDAKIARANPIENCATELLKWKNRIF